MRHLTWILGLCMLTGIVSCGEESLTSGEESDLPTYEVYVLMSASWKGFSRFSTVDNDDIEEKSQEETPITFAYIKGPDVEMVFGTGPIEETALSTPFSTKGSLDFVDQQTLLASIGADASMIETVVMEATCRDHTGGMNAFTNASFVIQKKEFDAIPTGYSHPDDNEKIKQLREAGRLEIIDGDKELVRGITAYFMGGHTPGCQFLSVNTEDGLVVLAGDGLYTYENLKYNVAGPYHMGVEEQLASYERIREVLGESDELLVPGHDMEVFRRFPKATDRVAQIKK